MLNGWRPRLGRPDPLHLPVDLDEAQDPDEADTADAADDGQDDVGPVETDGVPKDGVQQNNAADQPD